MWRAQQKSENQQKQWLSADINKSLISHTQNHWTAKNVHQSKCNVTHGIPRRRKLKRKEIKQFFMGNKISLSRPLRAGKLKIWQRKIIPRIQTYACVRTLSSTTAHTKNFLSAWSKDARAIVMLQFYDTQNPYQHESVVNAHYIRQNSSEIKPSMTASEWLEQWKRMHTNCSELENTKNVKNIKNRLNC